jgi:peptidyl-prolyl cis-trans isomerase SurA
MKKRFFSLVLLLSSISIIAQTNDPVVMKINGKDIKKSEFEYFYYKYNSDDVVDKITLDEYVKLFKNLKLRVAEAEAQGLDTTASFLTELSDYRAQLAKSYLKEAEVNEKLVSKEYGRMKELAEVSHILITFPGVKDNNFKIFPADTLEAYKKATLIRNRLLKGENFEKLAAELSEDPGLKENSRPGYLGWFPGMALNPPLEEIAFTTPVGQVGRLIRSNFGYHIIKVHGKKENPGQINAAHILIACPPNADVVQADDALKKINDIYDQLLKGADFAQLAKENSADQGSAAQGGELGWFGYGYMVKEFQDVAFDQKAVGDFSRPFKTQFGYHIVKLLDKKPIESFEEKREEIESKLNSGGYTVLLHQSGIDKLKEEYGFVKNETVYKTLFAEANKIYPSDTEFYEAFRNNSDVLFKVGDLSFSVADFIGYLEKNDRSPVTLSTDYLTDRLDVFEYTALQQAADIALESKFSEFRNLVQEYHDGILMFEIANREIWEKASDDTVGLKDYFEKNKDKFTWDEPYFKGYVVLVKDAKTKKKMQKEISKMQPEKAVEYLYENYRVGDVSYVKAEKGLYKKGDNAFVDEWAFKSGQAEKPEKPAEFQDSFLIGNVSNVPTAYSDVRGLVVTSYQDYLEKEWQEKLNAKYPVVVYRDVLITIK